MDKETWLLGSLAPQWDGNILPTSKDVLNSIYYLLYKKKLAHSEALDKLSNNLWYYSRPNSTMKKSENYSMQLLLHLRQHKPTNVS
jgi:hypothetical protein